MPFSQEEYSRILTLAGCNEIVTVVVVRKALKQRTGAGWVAGF